MEVVKFFLHFLEYKNYPAHTEVSIVPDNFQQDEVSSTSSLDRLRQMVQLPKERKLLGKFHAHLTFNLRDDRIESCRQWCRDRKAKLTIIDLANSTGRSQTDVMLTVHFWEQTDNAIERITEKLLELTELAEESGFTVTRVKLEHESLPTLSRFDKQHYQEVHIKLHIPAQLYEADYQRLLELGDRLGFVPSQNPLQRNETTITQFANLRIYEGNYESASVRIAQIAQALAKGGFSIKEVKRETIIFDTAQVLDAWWI